MIHPLYVIIRKIMTERKKKGDHPQAYATESYDRLMPNRLLLNYGCEEKCENFKVAASTPYHRALALLREHNMQHHQTGKPPKLMMVYKV
jgi:hypothetical protein